ncbi:MAG TPA: Gfo/Idh/MocA family oxidoreductase [Tepidisphaeraceae bacterium]|nr:Gfo/Idh/MocA family oxidoreductase [Tepidisphaeraceae bacterium]
MQTQFTRRRFLSGTAAAAATLASTRLLRGIPIGYSPNEKVNVAQIGTTGKGEADLRGVTKAGGNIVALCDVDASHVAHAARTYTQARQHSDFRKMLDVQKDIDAVVVTIPDHQHAIAALTAMTRGKHVYCQKPLTHDIFESRLLREAADRYKLSTQMGNEGHSSEGLRTQVDWVKAGVIGTVSEVHVWTDRPKGWWPQGVNRPEGNPPVPAGLDWDLWLGTAPERPYNPAYHPFKWRGFWDFGTGALGDMGCHIIDAPFWALDLYGPCAVEAECVGGTRESGPLSSRVQWEFPSRGSLPAVKMTWHDGGNLPPRPADMSDEQWKKLPKSGVTYMGAKGVMVSGQGREPHVLGEVGKDLVPPPRTIPKSPGHYVEWLEGCKGGPKALGNFDYSARLAEIVLLGNVAIRSGRRIEWDPTKFEITNAPEANTYLRREYRKGWDLTSA